MPPKGKVPPQFLKNEKKAKGAPAAVTKGDAVVDSKGKPGTVVAVMGGMVKVKHAKGTDVHPKGQVKPRAAKKKS